MMTKQALLVCVVVLALAACPNDTTPGGGHTHEWGAWTQTAVEGTEERVCRTDQAHTETRLTGTGRFGFTLIGNTAYRVRKGTAVSGEVHIPTYYRPSATGEYLPVTIIDDNAFEYCQNLTGITIPASVTSIGSHAFRSCISLASITVDAGNPNYTSENGILYNKAKTTLIRAPGAISGNVTIPTGVTSIGDSAFSGCHLLYSISIPASVTSIGPDAFAGCTSLESISIPAGVTYIGAFAFDDCSSLESITIPASVTSIVTDAFFGCTSLTRITVDWGNPNYASEGGILYNKAKTTIVAYPSASGDVTISAGVTRINANVFMVRTSLTSITLPAGMTSIGGWAFDGCTNLARITLPASVTSIGADAFSRCTSLASITIPASVTVVGDSAFNGWRSNQTIYVEGHANATAADTAWNSPYTSWRSGCGATIVYQGR